MFVLFDCCILQFIKNNCCRFNLETMTFIIFLIFSFQLSIVNCNLKQGGY